MRITTYRCEINDDGINFLAKESSVNYPDSSKIMSPKDVVSIMTDVFRLDRMAEEFVYEIAIDVKGKVLGIMQISQGSSYYSVAEPKDVIKRALLVGAARIIIVHNHPSGEPEPSGNDRKLTDRIKNACEIVGLSLDDSIIIGRNGNYFSFHEEEVREKISKSKEKPADR